MTQPTALSIVVALVPLLLPPFSAAAESPSAAVPPSFLNEVIPVLTRYECNSGGCHGKGAGQNGFKLSLRGFAPDMDYRWLALEAGGRRIAVAAPDQSLLLRKAVGSLPHGGGTRFAATDPAYQVLARWIAAGAPGPAADEPMATALQVTPKEATLTSGQTIPLRVEAEFSDGSRRDVTWLTRFFPGDSSVLAVTDAGVVASKRPGASIIRAHYGDFVAVAHFVQPYDHPQAAGTLAESKQPIDRHVAQQLASVKLPPSSVADDAEFLRRVFLSILGTLPSPAETRAFLADPAADKRDRLIDALVDRPEYVDYWTLQLADLLQNRKERDHDVRGTKGVRRFYAWLRQQVAANRPWDQLAREVLTATGADTAHPAVGYFVVTVGEFREVDKSDVVGAVAQTFLGTRIGCAQCHNHPLERYTQDDYYHFAAFFGRVYLDRQSPTAGLTTLHVATQHEGNLVKRQRDLQTKVEEWAAKAAAGQDAEANKKLDEHRQQLEQVGKELADSRRRPSEIRQPRTGRMMAPQPIDRTAVAIPEGQDPRVQLADWMTGPAKRQFAGALVNRVWKHFFAVGLVEPVDDLRPSNPPSNQPLWDYLCDEFIASGYDLKHLVRLIARSQTFQLTSATLPANAGDDRFYSHYYARRLPAEVLLDAVSQVTGVPDRFAGYPVGLRAVQVPDPAVNSYFLSLFGRSERTTACACERSPDVTLPQLLHLQNGDWIGDKLRSGQSRVAALADRPDLSIPALTEEAFLVTFCRFPRPDEAAAAEKVLSSASDRKAAVADLFWALLNSKEFTFNH